MSKSCSSGNGYLRSADDRHSACGKGNGMSAYLEGYPSGPYLGERVPTIEQRLAATEARYLALEKEMDIARNEHENRIAALEREIAKLNKFGVDVVKNLSDLNENVATQHDRLEALEKAICNHVQHAHDRINALEAKVAKPHERLEALTAGFREQSARLTEIYAALAKQRAINEALLAQEDCCGLKLKEALRESLK